MNINTGRVMKFINIFYLLISLLLFSCATPKPTITSIPDLDKQTPVYFSNNETSFALNGITLYNLTSFGTTTAIDSAGFEIIGAEAEKNELFNHPFGNFDYSDALEPSISRTSKYLAKANDDFSLIGLSFSSNVDIDIIDLSDLNNEKTYTIALPFSEYGDEKYQIPWSKKDDCFFGKKADSLYKINPSNNTETLLLSKKTLYDFSISPSENFVLVFADDSLHLYNFNDNTCDVIYVPGKVLGVNRKYIRSYCWIDDESKVVFSEGWKIFVYNLTVKQLNKIDVGAKVFSAEWIDNNQLLIVTGDYPSDMSAVQNNKSFKILIYSFLTDKFVTLHERINHEPFSIKPKISPSKKLILFSERNINGPYQVKLMTLDGQNENILAEGYLPFWGEVKK